MNLCCECLRAAADIAANAGSGVVAKELREMAMTAPTFIERCCFEASLEIDAAILRAADATRALALAAGYGTAAVRVPDNQDGGK